MVHHESERNLPTQQCFMNSYDRVAKVYTRLEWCVAADKSTLHTENGRCLSQWNTFPRDTRRKQQNLWLPVLREIWSQPGTDRCVQGWWGRGRLSACYSDSGSNRWCVRTVLHPYVRHTCPVACASRHVASQMQRISSTWLRLTVIQSPWRALKYRDPTVDYSECLLRFLEELALGEDGATPVSMSTKQRMRPSIEVNWLTENSKILPTDAEKSIGNTVHIHIKMPLTSKINVVYVSKISDEI